MFNLSRYKLLRTFSRRNVFFFFDVKIKKKIKIYCWKICSFIPLKMKVQVPTSNAISNVPNICVVGTLRNRKNVDVQTRIKEVCCASYSITWMWREQKKIKKIIINKSNHSTLSFRIYVWFQKMCRSDMCYPIIHLSVLMLFDCFFFKSLLSL